MTDAVALVKDAASLQKAIDQRAARIEVQGQMAYLSSLKLPAGTHLRGVGTGAELHFREGQPGLMLSADHQIADMRLVTDETQVALGLSDDAEDLGTLTIRNVRTVGRVHLEGSLARRGDLKLENIHVERADARLAAHRPGASGWRSCSKDKASRWTLEARNLSGGSMTNPLRGSGIFIFGGWFIPVDADPGQAPAPTHEGGTIELKLLTTGEVHADGGIPKGTSNLITGGVFVGSGVHAQSVVNERATTTYDPTTWCSTTGAGSMPGLFGPRSPHMEAAASVS